MNPWFITLAFLHLIDYAPRDLKKSLAIFCTLAKTPHQRGYLLKNIVFDDQFLFLLLPFILNRENNNNLSDTKNVRGTNIQARTPNQMQPEITYH